MEIILGFALRVGAVVVSSLPREAVKGLAVILGMIEFGVVVFFYHPHPLQAGREILKVIIELALHVHVGVAAHDDLEV